jgi:hypothetical protein
VQVQLQFIATENGNPIVTEDEAYIMTEGGVVYILTSDGREHKFTTVLTEALAFLDRILAGDPVLIPH